MNITSIVNRSIENATGKVTTEDTFGANLPVLGMLLKANSIVPPWWSIQRDMALRDFWKSVSHLSIAVYNASSLLTTIPMRIEATNPNNPNDVDLAYNFDKIFMRSSEFGKSLIVAKRKFVEDWLGTDNGGFMEVIGDGPPDGPILGAPYSLRHLDSNYCTRTSNLYFPVAYTDPRTGQTHVLHRSRVIFMSSMTSANALMNGVGFCAVSRSIAIAQNLYDIYIHKQEKLGSRPASKILIGAGIQANHIAQAMRMANQAMDNQGLSRYSKIVAIGSDNTDIRLDSIDLTSIDPFNEEVSITLGMFAISSAFGLPIQELWPGGEGRSGRDAGSQESRQRSKMTVDFNTEFEINFLRILPDGLRLVHDWRDDQQDKETAINQDIRARSRQRDFDYGGLTVRAARQHMMSFQDVTREQFRQMERDGGRLEDGTPIISLLYAEDLSHDIFTGIPENPTIIHENDAKAILRWIAERTAYAYLILRTHSNYFMREDILDAIEALKLLKLMYETGIDTDADTNIDAEVSDSEKDVNVISAYMNDPGSGVAERQP